MLGNWKGITLDESKRSLLTAKGVIFHCYILFSNHTYPGLLMEPLKLSDFVTNSNGLLQIAVVIDVGKRSEICSTLTP